MTTYSIKRSITKKALAMMLVLAIAFTFSFFQAGNKAFAASTNPVEAGMMIYGKTYVDVAKAHSNGSSYYYKFKTPA